MGDTKNHTPKSDKTMSDGPAKDAGYMKTKVLDGESSNSCEAYDGNAVFPLAEKNYLDGANGL